MLDFREVSGYDVYIAESLWNLNRLGGLASKEFGL